MNALDVRTHWANRCGEYAPEYYAHHGPNDTSELLADRLEKYSDRSDRILELGCSAGRHLAHLFDQGYTDLSGIDVNEHAFEVMKTTYPRLTRAVEAHACAIEEVLPAIPEDHFDAVYSIETLQHLHPDVDWVHADLARITDGLLITIENEGDTIGYETNEYDEVAINDEFPLYKRNWETIFTEAGFRTLETTTHRRFTIRTFSNG